MIPAAPFESAVDEESQDAFCVLLRGLTLAVPYESFSEHAKVGNRKQLLKLDKILDSCPLNRLYIFPVRLFTGNVNDQKEVT